MAVRYDPVLIAGIVEELRARWIGRRVESLRLVHDRREAWIRFSAEARGGGAGSELQQETVGPEILGLLLHPTRGFLLDAPAESPGESAAERSVDFRRLFLSRVWAPADERLIVLELAGGLRDTRPDLPPVHRIFVELHTNQWNVALTRGGDHRIEAVLWARSAGGRSLRPGSGYRRAEAKRSWSEAFPGPSDWSELLAPVGSAERRATLLRGMAWTSSLNVDWILGDAAGLDTEEALTGAYERYVSLRTGGPRGAWLLSRGSGLQPYPVELEPDARRVGSLLEGMRVAALESGVGPAPAEDQRHAASAVAPTEEARRLEGMLRRRIRDLEKKRSALQRQLEGESADALRYLGHVLLARKREVPRGADKVSLEDFDGRPIVVTLDPRLDVVRNAERLYDQARRTERAARALPGRIRRASERSRRLRDGLKELLDSGPSDRLWDLVGGRPDPRASPGRARRGSGEAPPPYRRYRSSGGLEIRVGRSSRANDELTFRHAAPEDIWLHARQAAGAHVILRWEKRDQRPSLRDLTEAAILAALHSEARHSSVVAVDWTRRKYVRKPRKAPPGAVLPERVTTLFVEPDPDAAERLRVDD